ncbi:uncharacterized protein [Paralichthys olivaceus]|uniref:uncharacterized protein n=1 Tax=Paralichthys olivaceus TaxID=8255 RepID=UPI00097D9EB2|nr:PREDICTED: keratin, type II cytoskeletal 1-like [Paralichthys olivaceus]
MADVFEFDDGSVDFRPFTSCADPEDELVASLASFVKLYDRHEDRLQRCSQSFTQTVARVRETQELVPGNKTIRGVFGGVLGAVSGGIAGGVGGALGAVAATTCQKLCGEISAVGATVGFAGSVFGGVAGGVFTGSVGGAVCTTASSSLRGSVSNALWVTMGFATGGAIGGVFGGTVGAAGGAVGGGFGALQGTRFAVYVVGGAADSFKIEKRTRQEVNVMQHTGHDFSETIKPLLLELNSIKTLGEKIKSSPDVQRVARQTAETLAAATAMEKTVGDSQRVTDSTQLVEEAAKQSRRICEELKTTRTDAEKLLISLRMKQEPNKL